MIFVMDVGNTNIVLGVYKEDELVAHWRLSTNRQATADEYGMTIQNLFSFHGLDSKEIHAVIISSVVPPLIDSLEKMTRQYFHIEPVIVGPGIKTGIRIMYDNPKEVGADRIVNAVAAYEQYGGPLIVVDFGTATTFCAITKQGDYLGGAIVPGIGISMEALFQRAAKLPRIELVKPKTVIGKNTVSSMQSGIIFGYAGLVDKMVNRIKEEMNSQAYVVATGGLSELISSEAATIDTVNPFLTLEGLLILYKKNAIHENSTDK